jgi:1,4-dihydroxy-2-naphthoate octaprenyltransferase
MPLFSLIALLALPFALKAIKGALNPDDPASLMPALANNVLAVLLTQILLGIGYILAKVIG